MSSIRHTGAKRRPSRGANPSPRRGAVARLAALLALVVLASSAPAVADAPHPLEGRVWSRAAPQVSREALVQALSAARMVLLGEVHDNGRHHDLRAGLIRDVLARRKAGAVALPAMVFEHARTELQPVLDRFASATSAERTADALFDLLQWERSGWPARALFAPLMTLAAEQRLALVAADVPRPMMQAVARRGIEALPTGEVSRLGLEAPLAAPLGSALLDELEASHCGLMPRTAFANMAQAQRLRDAALADALAAAARRHGAAILLAGNGHVRTDRGVPLYLRARADDLSYVAVLLLEVAPGRDDPLAYLPRDPAGAPAADYAIFTAPAQRPDPCVAMRARFGRK